jgi:poly(3-hydroxybutyrate) depolymerase
VKHKSLFAAIAVAALAVAVTLGLVAGGGFGGTASAATAQAPAAAAPAPAAGTATAGCGKAPALASGTHTIQSSGQTRSYILEVPSGYDSSHPYRLIFGFHWLNGTAQDVDSGDQFGAAWSYYGLRAQAGDTTIFVAPQGINNGWANTNGQDLTLVQNMLSLFESDLCIDTSEIFALGWSYGGAMTYAVACNMPTVFRAVAVYSGADLSGCSPGTQPVPYLAFHGGSDNVLPIADGEALLNTFVKNNGCTPQNPSVPAPGSLTHIVTTYSGCRSGYPVIFAAFDGGHTPDPVDGSTASNGDTTWTKTLTWQFFSQFQSTITGSTPTPTPTPTSTPTPTPTRTGACQVSYATQSQWAGGFVAQLTITNTSTTATSGWTLGFTFPGDQHITNAWNGTTSQNGENVTITNASYNGTIPAGGSVSLGFQGTWTSNDTAPTAFTLNGTPCTS